MKFSIETAKKEIEHMICQYFRKDELGNYIVDRWQRLPLFLIGPAGVGKTQIVEEVAQEHKLGFVSYSLVHHTRQTLMGLPVITEFSDGENEMKDTEYTLSELIGAVYKQIAKGKKEGILFLDEANCCPDTIQPMLLSFLQSKMLGSSRLPEGWMIVLCGNPPGSIYNKNARVWDGALMDRLRVIELEPDHKEFLQYAYERDFHPTVRFYLTIHVEDSYVCDREDGSLNLVTYRTWENLSKAIYDYEHMGFEITPVFLNEYIKVDRVVKSFYELYRYSILDSDAYSNILQGILEGNLDAEVIGNLKEKPVCILYGITNLCFRKLDKMACALLQTHERLKELKHMISDRDFNLGNLLKNEQVSQDMRMELENVWKTEQLGDVKERCIEVHNRYIEQLGDEIQLLIQKTENLFHEVRKLDNPVLLRFYVNTLDRSNAWIYILSRDDERRLENFREVRNAEEVA